MMAERILDALEKRTMKTQTVPAQPGSAAPPRLCGRSRRPVRHHGGRARPRAARRQIIDLNHALAKLGRRIDWSFLEERFGAVYADGPGQPPLPTRLMAGLAILKHTYDLSDEALCERWVENPYYQYLCGEEFFRHDLPFDRSSLTRWR
jgi:transposase, IS5 family